MLEAMLEKIKIPNCNIDDIILKKPHLVNSWSHDTFTYQFKAIHKVTYLIFHRILSWKVLFIAKDRSFSCGIYL